MSEDTERTRISFAGAQTNEESGLKRKKSSSRGSVNQEEKIVTFIDARGRIWTVEMVLPSNTTMETMRQIAKANISLMNNESDIRSDELCVLVEPEDPEEIQLSEVERVVIFHRKKLDKVECRR